MARPCTLAQLCAFKRLPGGVPCGSPPGHGRVAARPGVPFMWQQQPVRPHRVPSRGLQWDAISGCAHTCKLDQGGGGGACAPCAPCGQHAGSHPPRMACASSVTLRWGAAPLRMARCAGIVATWRPFGLRSCGRSFPACGRGDLACRAPHPNTFFVHQSSPPRHSSNLHASDRSSSASGATPPLRRFPGLLRCPGARQNCVRPQLRAPVPLPRRRRRDCTSGLAAHPPHLTSRCAPQAVRQ